MSWLKWTVAACVSGLAGCATPHIEQLRDETRQLYEARSRPSANSTRESVDADGAVRIALLKSPQVTGIYARLGFARAELYDAARLSNPVLGYAGLSGGGSRKTDWSLSQNFTELLFRGYRVAVARSQILLAEQRVAFELLELEASVRAAHVRYVGSRTVATMRDRIADSTRIAATYAQQLFDAGNISKLQLARMQEAAALARADSLRARADELADRNGLLTLLGLESGEAIQFVGDYSLPMAQLPVTEDVRAWALENRLDLLSAREALRFASIADTHTRRWRWLGESSLGISTEKEAKTLVGPSASLEIPLFNRGAGSVERAQVTVESLRSDVKALELSITNDIATRVAALAATRESVSLHREKIIQVQRTIVEESRKQQNYMLIGAFDLLAAKQHQYEGYEAYVGALRDYWLAYVELIRATGGRYPGAKPGSEGQRMESLAAVEAGP